MPRDDHNHLIRNDEKMWGNVAAGKPYSISAAVRNILASYGMQLVSSIDPGHKMANYRTLDAVTIILLRHALAGDLKAIEMVYDRLAGKPKQSIDLDATVKSHEDALKELDGEYTDVTSPPPSKPS